jgi:ubiquinone/menaquinone biosynthesis C-methylase UbiE
MLKKWRRGLKRRLAFAKYRLFKPALPAHAGGPVLLHIGCGRIASPEFINVDAQPYPHVHLVTDDIANLPQWDDGTVDMIYMSHILEHIQTTRLKAVLEEMNRLLKVGGILRLSVPDFDRLIEVYRAAHKDLDVIHQMLMGGQDSSYNIHYCAFNRKSLSRLLLGAGFREVRAWDPATCGYHDFEDKSCRVVAVGGQSIAISLNVEAIK